MFPLSLAILDTINTLNCELAEHDRCGRLDQHKPKRTRKLLLNKKEVRVFVIYITSNLRVIQQD